VKRYQVKHCADDIDLLSQAVHDQIKAGAEMILVLAGMSVDPDD
jgi:predicted DNA-binding protein YlxM (UPF0122 family)